MELNDILATCSKINQNQDDDQAVDLLTAQLQSLGFQEEEEEPTPRSDYRTRSLPKIQGDEYELIPHVYMDNPVSTWAWAGDYDVMYPYSLRGMVNGVKYALKHNRTMRCLGARNSFSLICETGDIYVDLSKTFDYEIDQHNEKVDLLDARPIQRLKASVDKDQYFHTLAGMKVAMINHLLCPDKEGDKARFGHRRMFNMAGVDHHTFAGAFSTGTHGTGGKYSAWHDTIRSLEIIAGDGTVYRVEPKDGITDPAKHQAFYDSHPGEVPVVLLQDDDKFYSAIVSMGCFGIIYSVIIEVTEMSVMHQDVIYEKYGLTEAFKEKLRAHVLPQDPNEELFYALQINPYRVKKDQPHSLMIKRTVVADGVEVKKNESRRKFWPTTFANLGLATKVIRHLANSGDFPKKRFIESTLKMQHDAGKKGGGYTDLAYKIWSGGIGKLKAFGIGLEFCIPVEDVPEIMDLFLAMLEQIGDEGRGYYLNSPISLRFARSSKAYLANNYYLDYHGNEVTEWCHFEIIRVNSTNEEDDIRERELFIHIQNFFKAHNARPHWGLNFQYEFSVELLQKLYPKFDEWLAAYRFFNSTGVFANKFTRRAGLDKQEEAVV